MGFVLVGASNVLEIVRMRRRLKFERSNEFNCSGLVLLAEAGLEQVWGTCIHTK